MTTTYYHYYYFYLYYYYYLLARASSASCALHVARSCDTGESAKGRSDTHTHTRAEIGLGRDGMHGRCGGETGWVEDEGGETGWMEDASEWQGAGGRRDGMRMIDGV